MIISSLKSIFMFRDTTDKMVKTAQADLADKNKS